ncbi:RNA polymerase sigma factor SigB [Bacillus sp. FJAT-47783]|uniref:RNA polymerase sigma factor SigB n=1 Tax=Bacillus sp. FJAT-47783 TaxID=2922712 RepID=UPI001FACBE40|nr:RNA polymerase sigma factor SigB [Bacillus sp. FJAT-47783]
MTPLSPKQKRSKEEINELICLYQEKEDQKAQEILVKHYENLVRSLAKKYVNGKDFLEDLIQVGMVGLLGAIHRYDSSIGKPFEAFAIPTIVGEMKRYLRDKTWSIHVPRRIKELGPKIKVAVDELTNELQRSPKVNEIATYVDASEEEVLEAMEMGRSYQALSVDHKMEADSDGSAVTILDVIGQQEQGYEHINQKLTLESVLHVLTSRERQIIEHLFFQNRSQRETGELLGISQMHVSRLQRRAIEKLRRAARIDKTETSSCFK